MSNQSTQHTIHSPGPLAFRVHPHEPNMFTIDTANGKWLMGIHHNGEQVELRQTENVRRLVACWNLLQSFTTEKIEAGQADLANLESHIAELLAALKGLLACADDEVLKATDADLADVLTDPDCPAHAKEQLAAFIAARAAIVNVERHRP